MLSKERKGCKSHLYFVTRFCVGSSVELPCPLQTSLFHQSASRASSGPGQIANQFFLFSTRPAPKTGLYLARMKNQIRQRFKPEAGASLT